VSALAYLGPEGTFTHQAALDLARPGDELRPAATAVDVVRAVAAGAVDGGVVAFENSLEGSVAENLDEILHTPEVVLAGERALPVSFALLRAAGDDAPLRAVASHPFALAQCARFLREHRLEAVEAASTAGAARELASGRAGTGIGALAPVTAAEVYGLRVEREGLEDATGPSTRFVVLRSRCPAPTGRDRSFFVVTPRRDEPGSLVRLLQEFSVRGINLTTIESRPTRALLGEYRFLIECEGHVADAHVRDAVVGLLRFPGDVRFLGSFPEDAARRGHAPAPELPEEAVTGYERMLEQVEA
jgi:prephenate dehydratase